MCEVCDESAEWETEPGTPERREEVMAKMRAKIELHGHQVIGVEGEYPSERFWYSVGLANLGQPEWLVTGGLPMVTGGIIINEAVRLTEGVPVWDGYVFAADTLLRTYPAKAVRCDPVAAEMNAALATFEGDPSEMVAYQILWPDSDGVLPDQPGYDDSMHQPVFAIQAVDRG